LQDRRETFSRIERQDFSVGIDRLRLPSRESFSLGSWLRRWAQWRAERLHAKIRRETVENDKRLEKALSFAGQAE
jgi:hypothetical protein